MLAVVDDGTVAVSVDESPGQMAPGDAEATTLNAVTFTNAVAVFVQPDEAVAVTKYEVLAAGEAVTDAPVVALRPEDGDHVYVAGSPLAVSSAPGLLAQMEVIAGVTETAGSGDTVAVTVPLSTLPQLSLTVTVYSVVVPTVATGLATVLLERPVAGAQV